MLSIFLPLYAQSPRDMAGVQWRPVRMRSPNVLVLPGFLTEARVWADVPADECWLLDSVLSLARGAPAVVGPPAFSEARVTQRILSMEDITAPGVPNTALTRIVNIDRSDVVGPAGSAVVSWRLGQTLFVPPSTRLLFTVFFDFENPGNLGQFNVSGIAFPRGNISQ